jgi:ubiquitin-protein ligase
MKSKYGLDSKINFVSGVDFKAKKRWIAEVKNFAQEMEASEGKYRVDTSQSQFGVVTVTVQELADGPLKKSMGDQSKPLIIHFEISREYPMSPPFVWVESPQLVHDPQNLSFGIFHGVPCLKELKDAGWTPIFSLSSVFVFVLNALAENARINQSQREANTRQQALSGSQQISAAHPDWE